MMNAICRTRYVSILAVLCFAPLTFAQVNMTLTSAGNDVMGGVFVDPYMATINGVSTQVICDDFLDDSWVNESWQANVHTVANVTTTGPQKFQGLSAPKEYLEASWLAEQLLNPTSAVTSVVNADDNGGDLRGDISFAIWTIFDAAAINGYGGNSLTTSQVNAVNGLISVASTAVVGDTLSQFSNVTIYTAIPGSATNCGGGPCPANSPQEFLTVQTPEAPVLANLGVDFSLLLGAFFVIRRRVLGRKLASDK